MLNRRRLLAAASATLAWGALARPTFAQVPEAGPDLPPNFSIDQFRALCIATARANVIEGRPIPSAAYPFATWMRDGYWTVLALGDIELMRRTYLRFAKLQEPNGRIPTAILNADTIHYSRDDESTAFFVLLALHLKRAGIQLEHTPLEKAARYMQSRTQDDGSIISGPGPFTWWLDTLSLAEPDVVTYTQGLWAVAYQALNELGVLLPPTLLRKVGQRYVGLYNPSLGTLTMSANTTLLDVSCLVGENLSFRYFKRTLLGSQVVQGTLEAFRKVRFPDGRFLGFPVVSQLDGSYLPFDWLNESPENAPGNYQNGGSWLLYDALALDAGRRHGVPGMERLFFDRLAAETRSDATLHEYISTDEQGTFLGGSHRHRREYAWNAYIATLI